MTERSNDYGGEVQTFTTKDTLHELGAVTLSVVNSQQEERYNSSPVESFRLVDTDESDAPEQQLHISGGTTDPVKDYLKNIGKVPLLTASGEVEISKRIEAGLFAERVLNGEVELESLKDINEDELLWMVEDGKQAKNHLIEANLRLVVSIAKKYRVTGMDILEIIQEGNTGLIRGVEKFDYKKGFKFSTYATWWIRQAITRGIADQSRTIRIPVHKVEIINKMHRTMRSMEQELNRDPTDEELAVELDLSLEEVLNLKEYARIPASINDFVGDDGDTEFGELIKDKEVASPDDTALNTLLKEELQKILDTFSAREADVIVKRFGLDGSKQMTLVEIGDVYGISRERVRQLEKDALIRLRREADKLELDQYIRVTKD